MPESRAEILLAEESPLAQAIRAGGPIFSNASGGSSAFLGLPLAIENKPIGAVGFLVPAGVFTAEDRDFARAFAGQCALALARSLAFQEWQDAEAELRRSERNLADFFEQAAVGLHWVDADGVILRANRAELELLGYTREEYVGRRITEVHADADIALRMLARLSRGETLQNFEACLVAKDGSIKNVLIDSNAQFEGERFLHTRSFTRDVTQMKRAAQGQAMHFAVTAILSESDALEQAALPLLRAVGESLGWSVGLLWTVDPGAFVLRCLQIWSDPRSPAPTFTAESLRMTFPSGVGMPGRVWATGRPAWIVDTGDDANFPRAPLAALDELRSACALPIVQRGQTVGVLEFFSRERRALDEDLLHLFADVGNRIGQFLERRKAQEDFRPEAQERARLFRQAVEASAQKTRFLAAVSHDLRTPVHAIALHSALLEKEADRRSLAEDDPLRATARRIGAAARAFTDLLASLLELSSFDAGQKTMREEQFSLRSLLDECVDTQRGVARAKGLDLRYRPPDRSLGLAADRTEVLRVVTNLISNGIKFTERGFVDLSRAGPGDLSPDHGGAGRLDTRRERAGKRRDLLGSVPGGAHPPRLSRADGRRDREREWRETRRERSAAAGLRAALGIDPRDRRRPRIRSGAGRDPLRRGLHGGRRRPRRPRAGPLVGEGARARAPRHDDARRGRPRRALEDPREPGAQRHVDRGPHG